MEIYIGVHDYNRHPLGGILSVCETLEQLHLLEKVTRAYMQKAMSSKWVKYQFWGELFL